MTHSENYVIFLETHPPPKFFLDAILPFSYVRSEFFCFRISEINLEFHFLDLSIFIFSLVIILPLSLLFKISYFTQENKFSCMKLIFFWKLRSSSKFWLRWEVIFCYQDIFNEYRTIYSISERSVHFLKQTAFFLEDSQF